MLKIAGSLMVLFCGFSIGYLIMEKDRKKALVYQQLSGCIKEIYSGMDCYCLPLPEIFMGLSNSSKDHVAECFASVGKEMMKQKEHSIPGIWKREAKNSHVTDLLGEEDEKILMRCLTSLGTQDRKSQLDSLLATDHYFEKERTRLLEGRKEKTKLAYTLGILGSLFVIILFI